MSTHFDLRSYLSLQYNQRFTFFINFLEISLFESFFFIKWRRKTFRKIFHFIDVLLPKSFGADV